MAFIRTPNQQDLSWFLDMEEQNRLDLDPPYQRRSVWTAKDKQDFLDTIFNNYPCPAIYLQKEQTPRGPKYNVVDGKQRLSTIISFFKGKTRISKNFSIVELRGKRFSTISDEYKTKYYNYIFMVEQIRSGDDNEYVDWGEVFQRVNKNQKTLKEQELRHARFDGWLINRAEKEVEQQDLWQSIGVSTRARKNRMKDVEFVSILMLSQLEKRFVGFPQWRIDELYAKYDFELSDLPEDEAAANFEAAESDEQATESDDAMDTVTREQIIEFETTFSKVRDFITKMENHNQSISRHKKRIFTDLYSLWCAIAFEDQIINQAPSEIAEKYDDFIRNVDETYEKRKKSEDFQHNSPLVQKYYNNSIGASTEEEPRKQRHSAIVEHLTS